MNNVKERKWANAYRNQHFICIHTCSGYRASVFDPSGRQSLMSIDVDDKTLGTAVLESLTASRFLAVDQVGIFFDRKLVAENYDNWTKDLIVTYRYKSKTALFKKMILCNIEMDDHSIVIRPTRHEKLETWGKDNADNILDVLIAVESPPEEIGEALRLGFSRCVE